MTVCCTHFRTPFLSYPLLKPAAHGQPGLAAEGTVVVHRQTIRCQDQRDLAILAENGNNLTLTLSAMNYFSSLSPVALFLSASLHNPIDLAIAIDQGSARISYPISLPLCATLSFNSLFFLVRF